MTIIAIIYAVAWLILLATYLFKRKESTFNWSEADGTEKFVLFLIILFAPIVVLFFPFMLYSQTKSNKKSRKAAEERESEEREYRAKALSAMQQAKANPAQKASSEFKSFLASARSAYSTNFYTHMQKEENYPMIMTILHKLSLPK